MLVLRRKAQESISIGDGVVVSVLKIQGNTVKLGVEAPDSERVLRTELKRYPDRPRKEKAGRETAKVA